MTNMASPIPGQQRVVRGISWDPRIMAGVDQFAAEVGINRSEAVNMLLSLALQNGQIIGTIKAVKGVITTEQK